MSDRHAIFNSNGQVHLSGVLVGIATAGAIATVMAVILTNLSGGSSNEIRPNVLGTIIPDPNPGSVTVTADKLNLFLGEMVRITANVKGMAPPYLYDWATNAGDLVDEGGEPLPVGLQERLEVWLIAPRISFDIVVKVRVIPSQGEESQGSVIFHVRSENGPSN